MEYKNDDSLIKKIEIKGYEDGHIEIALFSDSMDSSDLQELILQSCPGLSVNSIDVPPHVQVHNITQATQYTFPALLNIIETNTQNFHLIRQKIEEHFQHSGEVQEGVPIMMSSQMMLNLIPSFFFPVYSFSSEGTYYITAGDNADKLETLEFKDESGKKEFFDSIPREFICAISGSIMTDPVIDPRTPSCVMERTAIESWLETNDIHPLTKAKLLKEDLKLLPELKNKIDELVQKTLEEFKKPNDMYGLS